MVWNLDPAPVEARTIATQSIRAGSFDQTYERHRALRPGTGEVLRKSAA